MRRRSMVVIAFVVVTFAVVASTFATAAAVDGGPDGPGDFTQIARSGLAAGSPSSGPVPAPSTPVDDAVPPLSAYDGTSANSYAWSSAWFDGHLYVGTVRNAFDPENAAGSERRAEIWRYDPGATVASGDGTDGTWERVYRSPLAFGSVPRDVGYRGMVVCDAGDGVDRLYVSTIGAGGRVLHTTDGVTFSEATTDGLRGVNLLAGDFGDIGYRSVVCVDGDDTDGGAAPWLYISPVGRLDDITDFSTLDSDGSANPVVLGTSDPIDGVWEEVSLEGFGDPDNGANFVLAGFDGNGNGVDEGLVAVATNRSAGAEVWVSRAGCTGTSAIGAGGLFGGLLRLFGLGPSTGPGPCPMESTWELAVDAGAQRPLEVVGGVPALRSTVGGAVEQFGEWVYVTLAETRSLTRDASSELIRFRHTGATVSGYEWDTVVAAPRPLSATVADPTYLCGAATASQCDPLSGYGAGFAEDGPGTLGDPNEGEAEYIWRLLAASDGRLYATTNVSGLLNPDPFESPGSIEDRLLGIGEDFEAGFNMYRTDDGVVFDEMFDNGLGNPLNSGGRALVDIPGVGLAVGTANANTGHPLGGFEVYVGGCTDGADPVANAGLDRTWYDDPTEEIDDDEVTVALNGVWSDAADCDATITAYQWYEGTCGALGDPVPGGTTARVEGLTVDVGADGSLVTNPYALVVTDSDDRTGCDDVAVTASTDQPPDPTIASVPVAHCQFGVPDAFCGDGLLFEVAVGDVDGDGFATVELDGSCPDREDGTAASCEWVVPSSVTLGGPVDQMQNTATVPVGGFRGVVLYLKAVDSKGQVRSEGLAVSVQPPSAPDLAVFDDLLVPVASGDVAVPPYFCEGLPPGLSRCDVVRVVLPGPPPPPVQVGEPTQLAVLVRNQANSGGAVTPAITLSNAAGDTFSPAFVVPAFGPPQPLPVPAPGLVPGAQTYYVFDWTPTTAGPQQVSVAVAALAGESDLDDNTAEVTFDVAPADPPDVDAAITSVTPELATMDLGDAQDVAVTVANNGTGPVDVTVTLSDDDGEVGSQTVEGLGSGDDTVVDFVAWTPSSDGPQTLTATVTIDAGGTDEVPGNDSATATVVVSGGVEAHVHAISTTATDGFVVRFRSVAFTVHDAAEAPVVGAEVTVSLSGGLFNPPETRTCVTNGAGTCTVTDTLFFGAAQTWTVTDIEVDSASVYVPAANDWNPTGPDDPAFLTDF